MIWCFDVINKYRIREKGPTLAKNLNYYKSIYIYIPPQAPTITHDNKLHVALAVLTLLGTPGNQSHS